MENYETRPADMLQPNPDGETKEISLENVRPKSTVKIGADLGEKIKVNLISLLRDNADVFVLSANKIPGMDPTILVHRQNVNGDVSLVTQKKRNFSSEKEFYNERGDQ